MMKQLTIFLVILFICGNGIAQTDPDWVFEEIAVKRTALQQRRDLFKPVSSPNQTYYDVGYYGIDLDIDIENEEIAGQVLIRGKSRVDNLAAILLNLFSGLHVDSIYGGAATYQHNVDLLTVYLSEPVDFGQIFEIGIAYHGQPVAAGLKGFSFEEHDEAPIVSTLSEPFFAQGWFPCKDVPADKADSADIYLTAPSNLTAISNGVLIDIIDNQDGTATTHWQERYPIATYLISLAITNYNLIEQTYVGLDGKSMPVYHWYYPESESSTNVLRLTTDMIAFFAGMWGEYPFINEKYGHAQFSWGGAMEHQTCTSLGSYRELMICHELAHQWWGDMVTCANWKEIWLNEGFARYSEALWKEHTEGETGYKEFMKYIERPEYWQDGPTYIMDTTNVNSIFDLLVYDKGAWILHMLRGVVGDSLFFEIYPAYRDAFYMDVATTDGFKNICETIYKNDLDWFFDQWIFGSGMPDCKISWQRQKLSAQEWQMTLKIVQTQSRLTPFRMPVEVLVKFSDSDTLLTIEDSLLTQLFEFQFTAMPEDVIIDPDNWVLNTVEYMQIDPDGDIFPDNFMLMNPYPNPFNNAVNVDVYLEFDTDSRIVVYDIRGREVDVINGNYQRAGYYELVWEPLNLPSGVYIIRLENNWTQLTKKVVYLK